MRFLQTKNASQSSSFARIDPSKQCYTVSTFRHLVQSESSFGSTCSTLTVACRASMFPSKLMSCCCVQECENLMEKGWKNRATGSTLMNADSSRLATWRQSPELLCEIIMIITDVKAKCRHCCFGVLIVGACGNVGGEWGHAFLHCLFFSGCGCYSN